MKFFEQGLRGMGFEKPRRGLTFIKNKTTTTCDPEGVEQLHKPIIIYKHTIPSGLSTPAHASVILQLPKRLSFVT